jgi:DNA-binding XRE family transcriptional regulator
VLGRGNFTTEDFAEVQGQPQARRAIEVAIAGGHNILMVGSPGAGKTMLARRIPSIMPPMTLEECLEATRVYSVAGLLPADTGLVARRPFRSPHHTVKEKGYPSTLITVGDHRRACRMDRGLLQSDTARRIGVHTGTLRIGERNRAPPKTVRMPGVIGFLGYCPFRAAATFGDWLRQARRAEGHTRRALANTVGIDQNTGRVLARTDSIQPEHSATTIWAE